MSSDLAAIGALFAFGLLFLLVVTPLRGTNQSSLQSVNDSHADIVASDGKTAMAHASGIASFEPLQGEFFHGASGVHYRVAKEADGVWLHFNRNGAPQLHGKREFIYYIGSGRLKGRTYLFN